MADLGNLPLTVHEIEGNNQILKMQNDMTYVVINCPDNNINELYTLFHTISQQYDSLFHVLPPLMFQNQNNLILSAKCVNPLPLSRLLPKELFISVKVYRRAPNRAQNFRWMKQPQYLTPKFKRFIWSLIRFIKLFSTSSIRPVIDPKKMFIAENDNVIFTTFVDRGTHNIDNEAQEVRTLLMMLAAEKAAESDTIREELDDLGNWCINTRFGLHTSEEEAFTKAAFWSPRVRMSYMDHLYNYVATGPFERQNVFYVAADAFHVGGQTNWRLIIESGSNPVLKAFLTIGDKFFNKRRNKNPSPYRGLIQPGFHDSEILTCAIYRFRDAFCHFHENKGNYMAKSEMNVEDLQSVLQYEFPSHMVKLTRAGNWFHFAAKEEVLADLMFYT